VVIYVVGDSMVYCPECGEENEDGAIYCTKCGAPLKEGVAPRYARQWNEKEERQEKDEKYEKDWRYEKAEEGRNWGLLIGLLILLSGAISLAESWFYYSWDDLWPLMVIVIGLFIVWNGLKARGRSPRP
jgi:hypothetical protein